VDRRAGVTLAVFALVTGASATGAAVVAAEADDGVIVHEVDQSPQEVRQYWTPERVREANEHGL
jgi:hypothetical protein